MTLHHENFQSFYDHGKSIVDGFEVEPEAVKPLVDYYVAVVTGDFQLADSALLQLWDAGVMGDDPVMQAIMRDVRNLEGQDRPFKDVDGEI